MPDAPTDAADAPTHEAANPARPSALAARLQRSARASWGLLAITLLAVVFRVSLVTVVHPTCDFDADAWVIGNVSTQEAAKLGDVSDECFRVGSDALYLYLQGRHVGQGEGFINPIVFAFDGTELPGAGKPPMMPLVVAGLANVGVFDATATRLVGALLGGLAVGLIGLVGQRIGGRRVGLVAAAIAASYPMLWINDWRMMNESPYVLFLALALLWTYDYWMRPGTRTALKLGAAFGLAALCRPESLMLAPLVVIPITLGLPKRSWGDRAKLVVIAGAATAIVVAPWISYNLSRFNRPTYMTSGAGQLLQNGTCESTYFGDRIGYLDFQCFDLTSAAAVNRARLEANRPLDESEIDNIYFTISTQYISDNSARLPIVVLARLGRMWDLYAPFENTRLNIASEGRGTADSWVGLWYYYALLPPAAAGLVGLWRRRVPISPYVGSAVVISFTAAISFGLTRYRVPVDVGLCVLAAIGIDAAWRRWVRKAQGPYALADAPAEVMARARRSPTRSPRLVKGAAIGAAVVVAISGVAGIASAGVEPVRTVRELPTLPGAAGPTTTVPGTTGTTQDVEPICAFTKDRHLTDLSTYGNLDIPTVTRLEKDLNDLRPLVPATQLADLDFIIGVLNSYRTSGLSGADWVRQTPPATIQQITVVADRLTAFLTQHCPI